MISVVIPTIPGREEHLETVLAAYEATTHDYELIVVRGQPTCGAAWHEGARQATGDYVHLGCDDVEPLKGWWRAAVATVSEGKLPCPRVVYPDGTLESCGNHNIEKPTGTKADVVRVGFLPASMRDILNRLPKWHYMHDYWITDEARKIGWPTVVNRKYAFVHHFSMVGRIDSLADDIARYNKAKEVAA